MDVELCRKPLSVDRHKFRSKLLKVHVFSQNKLHLLVEVLDALCDTEFRGIFLNYETVFDINQLRDFGSQSHLLLYKVFVSFVFLLVVLLVVVIGDLRLFDF